MSNKADWTAVFGNFVTARDVIDGALRHNLDLTEELRRQYRELAEENPNGDWDDESDVDFRALAQQIIREATGKEWWEQEEIDLG